MLRGVANRQKDVSRSMELRIIYFPFRWLCQSMILQWQSGNIVDMNINYVSSINHDSGIDLWSSEYETLKLTVRSLHSLPNFRKPHSLLWMWKPNVSTEVAPFPANFLPFYMLWTEDRNMSQTHLQTELRESVKGRMHSCSVSVFLSVGAF